MRVIELPDGSKGFDCNTVITAPAAQRFKAAAYSFALRYIRRDPKATNDLSVEEIAVLHQAGLLVAPVQHFGPHEGWQPTDQLGREYGTNAAEACIELGIPSGASILLDLEGIDPTVDPEIVIRYCNRWHDIVGGHGFSPAIYVGVGSLLTPSQLYRRLKFTRYMAAYNLNLDQYPAVRGVCVRQHEAQPGDRPEGVRFPVDVDTAVADRLGGRLTVVAP